MRVIQQIVEYLEQQGTLTQDDLYYLRSEGFVPYPMAEDGSESADDTGEPFDEYDMPARERKRRGRRRFLIRGHNLTAGELRAAISTRLPQWAVPLEGLIALAKRLDSTASITTAPLILLQADLVTLDRLIHDAIAARQPSLKTLWKSLDFTEFLEPARNPGETVDGPVVRAYRWLLRVTNRHEAPGCGWLLRYWQVRWAVQLVGAQKRILESLGRLYDADWNLINRELCRERHDGAFWAFTLVYNARRFTEGLAPGMPASHLDEKRLAGMPVSDADWLRAWSHALAMDRERTRHFLGVHGSEIGLQAVTVDDHGTVLHWNTQTGRTIRRWEGHTDCVSAIAFTTDGNRAVTGSKDGTARLWDVNTGTEIQCFDNRDSTQDAAWCVALSPDEALLATGSGETGKLYIWDVETGKRRRIINVGSGALWSIAWSPCGAYIATAGASFVRLYDPQTGRKLRSFSRTYIGTCVTFSPDGNYLIAGDENGKVWLWQKDRTSAEVPWYQWSEERQIVSEYRIDGNSIQWVAVSPDNQYMTAVSDQATLRLCKLPHGTEHRWIHGHTLSVYSVSLSGDGNLALTTGRDKTARLWDLITNKELRSFTEHKSAIWCGALRPNSTGVALVAPSRWEKVFV